MLSKRGSSFTTRALPQSLMGVGCDVIHQEDERLGVLRQIAERDVLPIAAKVGKAQSLVIDLPVRKPGEPPRY